jgi:2-polyprenyl-3-methyl-5-hydroxy-6-metoxy-1,4-benzoquinol methylase
MYRYEKSRWIPGVIVRCDECQAIWRMLLNPDKPIADYYDDSYAAHPDWELEQEATVALRKVLDGITSAIGVNNKSLLDVGSGPGLFLALARDAGYRVTGVELNPALAERARKTSNVEVLTGEFLSLPMGDRKFDVITLLDLIEHVPDPIALLKRCRELLNPGGHVVAYTPNHSGLIVRIANLMHRLTLGRVARPAAEIFDGVHIVFFDARSLGRVFKEAGLPPVNTTMLKYDPTRTGQAKGVSAMAVRAIETVSPMVNGEFRLLMIGRKDEATA